MSGAKHIVQTQLPENTFLYEIEIETGGKKESKGEEEVQREDSSLLYEFWNERGGRDKCLRKSGICSLKYHIFDVLGYDSEKTMYEVQWVKYRPTDTTWESAEMVQTATPPLLSRFWSKYWKKNCVVQEHEIDGCRKFAWGIGLALKYIHQSHMRATRDPSHIDPDSPFQKG
ncbi:hypothetical protein PG987_010006 [Apiospora arundinis]